MWTACSLQTSEVTLGHYWHQGFSWTSDGCLLQTRAGYRHVKAFISFCPSHAMRHRLFVSSSVRLSVTHVCCNNCTSLLTLHSLRLGGDADVSCTAWFRTTLLGVVIHMCRRHASTEQLDVPTCRRSTVGGRAFPVAAAKVWNGLPSDVTSASSLSVFKNKLKTYLFRRCYETV